MVVNDDEFLAAGAPYRVPSPAAVLRDLDPFQFYFVGSRWMGGATEASDWDFMVTDSPGVRIRLTDLGFTSRWCAPGVNDTYDGVDDGVTRDVFETENVQVQLVEDADRKFRAAQRIKAEHFEEHLQMTSAERSALWASVYSTV